MPHRYLKGNVRGAHHYRIGWEEEVREAREKERKKESKEGLCEWERERAGIVADETERDGKRERVSIERALGDRCAHLRSLRLFAPLCDAVILNSPPSSSLSHSISVSSSLLFSAIGAIHTVI